MTEASTTEKSAVGRGGGVALWRQIADQLRNEIAGGVWTADAALPTEVALATRFGVNRHTVRRALAALSADGLVRSDQGRGTFVLAGRLTYPISRRTRFSEIVSRQAREPGGRMIASRVESADVRLSGFLEVPQGTPLICLETLSVADGVPISVSLNWFSADRFPNLVTGYAETGSITAAVKAEGVENYLRRWTRVRAETADAKDRDRLQLPVGASLLVTEALNEDQRGNPLHFSITRFAADRIELEIESRPEPRG
ncbi:phosphonate metabolism transcriptional regulator PhnF [Bauldia sp.]|uniref:phosphonate metabolism transcriptional regulator PhnF n=1 Tax=Bauldia sp. TaxID=2575872 RepID=UPI003BA8BA0A